MAQARIVSSAKAENVKFLFSFRMLRAYTTLFYDDHEYKVSVSIDVDYMTIFVDELGRYTRVTSLNFCPDSIFAIRPRDGKA